MKPEIFGLPAYHLLWGLGIAVWIAGAGRLGRRGGFAAGRSMLFAAAMIAAILVGAKAQHLWENPQHLSASWSSLLLQGYRLPGGLALVAAIVLIGAYGLRLPILPFVDTVIPLAGVSLAVGRLGCFLNGCCFGKLCALPWAVRFPPGSRAHTSHFLAGLVGAKDWSAPVHPLQLYYIVLYLAVAAVVLVAPVRYDGFRSRLFLALWGWGTVFLEGFRAADLLRGAPIIRPLAFVVAVAMTTLLVGSELLRARQSRARALSPALGSRQ